MTKFHQIKQNRQEKRMGGGGIRTRDLCLGRVNRPTLKKPTFSDVRNMKVYDNSLTFSCDIHVGDDCTDSATRLLTTLLRSKSHCSSIASSSCCDCSCRLLSSSLADLSANICANVFSWPTATTAVASSTSRPLSFFSKNVL